MDISVENRWNMVDGSGWMTRGFMKEEMVEGDGDEEDGEEDRIGKGL